MPTRSAAFGSFQVKFSSTSLVKVLVTVTVLPFFLTDTFLRSFTLLVSTLIVRWYSAQRNRSMQTFASRHSSKISIEALRAILFSFCTGSGVPAVSSSSGCVSSGRACFGSGNAASTIAGSATEGATGATATGATTAGSATATATGATATWVTAVGTISASAGSEAAVDTAAPETSALAISIVCAACAGPA